VTAFTENSAASTIVARIRRFGVIPVVELDSLAHAEPLMGALYAAGLPVAEITLRTAVGLEALARLRDTYPDAFIGAGTVRSLADARRVIDAGAQFVASPATNPDVIQACLDAGIVMMPGACSPTEVDVAVRAGAQLVKFFPAEAMGGVAFLKALAGPFRDVAFVPTGGVNATNLAGYLVLDQVAACGGSWMVAPSLLREESFDRVEALAREAVEIVADVRGRAVE
jgi:2-dehydro-3-deoxyphosphogluconate aldolase/(4S)-4-hydroxy-2-oxoglutarate aldolase